MDISEFTPDKGQLTWSLEGLEKPGSIFHSRTPHVPSDTSGVTIGRGYDCKERSAFQIEADLLAAKVDANTSKLMAGAAGKSGELARKYIQEQGLDKIEITPESQKILFESDYKHHSDDTRRLCTKVDVQSKYGKCNWEHMEPVLQELLIDMRYRGDYTPVARARMQKAVAKGNYKDLMKYFETKSNFPKIDDNRFNERKKKMRELYERKRIEDKLR